MLPRRSDEAPDTYAWGTIQQVLDQTNPSGFGTKFDIGRDVESDELQAYRNNNDLLTGFTTGSPLQRLNELKVELSKIASAALAEWNAGESDPAIATLAGLRNLVTAFASGAAEFIGGEATSLRLYNHQWVVDEEWTFEFNPEAAQSISIVGREKRATIQELLDATWNTVIDMWSDRLLTAEPDIRKAIVATRTIAAGLIDGVPVLFHRKADQPDNITFEIIDLSKGAVCLRNIAAAHAHSAVSSDSGNAVGNAAEDVGGNGAQQTTAETPDDDGSPGAGTLFDADLLDLPLMMQSLSNSTIELQYRWSNVMSQANIQTPEFDAILSALIGILTRLNSESTRSIIDPAGQPMILPAHPAPVGAVVNLLKSNTPEDVFLRQVIGSLHTIEATLQCLTSFKRATMVSAASGSGTSQPFWNDGAFHSVVLHLDMLTQTVLQQIAAQQGLAAGRMSQTLTFTGSAEQAQATFAMSACPQSSSVFYRSLAVSSWRLGDYLATIFHVRNYLDALESEGISVSDVLGRTGSSDAQVSEWAEYIVVLRGFVDVPKFDSSVVVNVARLGITLIDQIGRSSSTVPDASGEVM